jgi:hypothetical protein
MSAAEAVLETPNPKVRSNRIPYMLNGLLFMLILLGKVVECLTIMIGFGSPPSMKAAADLCHPWGRETLGPRSFYV